MMLSGSQVSVMVMAGLHYVTAEGGQAMVAICSGMLRDIDAGRGASSWANLPRVLVGLYFEHSPNSNALSFLILDQVPLGIVP